MRNSEAKERGPHRSPAKRVRWEKGRRREQSELLLSPRPAFPLWGKVARRAGRGRSVPPHRARGTLSRVGPLSALRATSPKGGSLSSHP